MMDLCTCQRILCQALAPSASPVQFDKARRLINHNDTLPDWQRLNVYRHSITGMQQRVLGMVYPVCKQIMGEACFDTLARDYAWQARSNHADLNGYGAAFSELLEESVQNHSALTSLPYLGDLARLEWHWHQGHFAKDDEPFNGGSLAGLADMGGENLVPILSHSLAVLASPWPILAIWQSHINGHPDEVIAGLPDKQYLLIYRQNGSVWIETIDQDSYAFFTLCAQDGTLRQLAEALGDRAGPVFERVADFIRRGWITGFSVQE